MSSAMDTTETGMTSPADITIECEKNDPTEQKSTFNTAIVFTTNSSVLPIRDSFPVQATPDQVISEEPKEETTLISLREKRENIEQMKEEAVHIPKLSKTRPFEPRHERTSDPQVQTCGSSDLETDDTEKGISKKEKDSQDKYKSCKIILIVITLCVSSLALLVGISLWGFCFFSNTPQNNTDTIPQKSPLNEKPDINSPNSGVQIVSLRPYLKYIKESNKRVANLTWRDMNSSVANINENGRYIHIIQNGTYMFLLSLNIDTWNQDSSNENNSRRVTCLVCLRNSRGKQETCQKQQKLPNTSGPLSIKTVIYLYRNDFVWVSVVGTNFLYLNNAMNSMTIVKL